MARKFEIIGLYGRFVDRRRYQNINCVILECLRCSLKRFYGKTSNLLVFFSKFYGRGFLPNVEHIDLAFYYLIGIVDAVKVNGTVKMFLEKGHGLDGCKYNRRAKLKHPWVFKGFENDFRANAVEVTHRNPNFY